MLELVNKGWSRDDAYTTVQSAAFSAIEEGRPLQTVLNENEQVSSVVTETELSSCFDYNFFTKHIDSVFNRMALN